MLERVTQILVKHAFAIAQECEASVLFLPLLAAQSHYEQVQSDWAYRVLPIVRADYQVEARDSKTIRLPEVAMTRMGQIKLAAFLAASRGLIAIGDKALFLIGDAEAAQIDTVFITEVSPRSDIFTHLPETAALAASARPEVVARVIDLALALGIEGREGKPTGVMFIVGDAEKVLALSRPLVLNPFRGYSPAERNILDPQLEETVKEFAAMDGAFVIDDDGVIEACGMLLHAGIWDEHDLPAGLGVRHHIAAGITALTKALAIVVSESTGTVRVFMGGHTLTQIDQPRRTRRARRWRSVSVRKP